MHRQDQLLEDRPLSDDLELGQSLSPQDQRLLGGLDKKLQLIRDRVAGVAMGRHTGLFIGGRGGIGKSHTVEEELRRLNIAFKLWNSSITARCLFDRLASNPEAIHVVEDAEGVCKDRRAVGVLRSALWGTRGGRDGRMERLVTWNAKGASDEFVFRGGIVVLSNRRLGDLPELEALKTRIAVMVLDVSDAEIAAVMRRIALKGFPKHTPSLDTKQCLEVVDFILTEAERINRRLDVRLLINSLEDRLQSEDLEAGCSWRDLVAARIAERSTVVDEIESVGVRERKKAEQLDVAREIMNLNPAERFEVWSKKTNGTSRPTMYRRLAQLGRGNAAGDEK